MRDAEAGLAGFVANMNLNLHVVDVSLWAEEWKKFSVDCMSAFKNKSSGLRTSVPLCTFKNEMLTWEKAVAAISGRITLRTVVGS